MPPPPSDAHMLVLATLALRPGITPEDVAQSLGFDVEDVLAVVADLEAAGFVQPGAPSA